MVSHNIMDANSFAFRLKVLALLCFVLWHNMMMMTVGTKSKPKWGSKRSKYYPNTNKRKSVIGSYNQGSSMLKRLLFLSFIITAILAVVVVVDAKSHRKRKDSHPGSRSAKFLNRSGAKVDIFWVHPDTGELAHSNTDGVGVVWGGETGISTYVGHTFEVLELEAGLKSHKCLVPSKCRTTRFTINANEDQVYTIDEQFQVTVEDNKSRSMRKARQALETCRAQQAQRDPHLSPEEQITQLANCMDAQVQKTLQSTQDEIAFQATLRLNMGADLVNYTCSDPGQAVTTETYRNESWAFTDPTTKRKVDQGVQVLFETETTAVKYIPNMLTAEQCQTMMAASRSADEEASSKEDDTQSSSSSSSSSSPPRRLTLPIAAKKSMPIVQILMKLQNLYRNFLGVSVAFLDDPLLELHQHVPADPTLAQGECAATCNDENEKDGKNAADCAKSDGNPSTTGVRRISLGTKSSTGETKNVEDDDDDDDGDSGVITTTILLVCSTGQGSALHFPRTGTHVATKQVGDAVLIIHRDAETGESEAEAFLDDLAVCQPWSGELVYAVHQHRLYLKEE